MFIDKNLAIMFDENLVEGNEQQSQQKDKNEKQSQNSSQSPFKYNSNGLMGQVSNFRGCNCKKSKCLKMYCQCYLVGIKCNDTCKCINCENATQHDSQGRKLEDEELFQAARKFKSMHKGCNCKKSQCLKKYCECFNLGIPCNSMCKCEQCKNSMAGDTSEHQHSLQMANSAPLACRNKQLSQKIESLVGSVKQQHRQSLLEFVCYLLN